MRGKKGKQKKMKDKYADQDEEERALVMSLLGSAGKSKAQIAREAKQREYEEKQAKEEQKLQRQRENAEKRQQQQQQKQQQRRPQKQEARPGAEADAGGGGGEAELGADGDAEDAYERMHDKELETLLAEPSVAALDEETRAAIRVHDLLTGCPGDKDELLYAVPVCAPYSVLTGYKFKCKLTPGNQKKGKAAKQAVGIFCAAGASAREKELMRALKDADLVQNMLGNVKLVASGKDVAQASRAAKSERKEKATAQQRG